MKDFFNILKNIISTIDWVYISIIVISLFSGIILHNSSIKLILISIAILFVIALISSLAQKFTDYYSNFPKSTFNKNYDYKITTQSNDQATRKTIENFDNKDEYLINIKNENNEESEKSKSNENNSEKSKFYYFDEFSSVRVVRKIDSFENINNEGQNMGNIQLNFEDSSDSSNNNNKEQTHDISENLTNDESLKDNNNNIVDEFKSEPSQQINLNFEKIAMDFPINTFFENHPLFGNEPKQELEYFLSRILMIIKSSISANTVALFFLNPSEKKLNLYSFITENNDLLSKIREFSIDNDILSEILINA
nr:hypothetical protein [Candidatus Kapabacteria bacterium]